MMASASKKINWVKGKCWGSEERSSLAKTRIKRRSWPCKASKDKSELITLVTQWPGPFLYSSDCFFCDREVEMNLIFTPTRSSPSERWFSPSRNLSPRRPLAITDQRRLKTSPTCSKSCLTCLNASPSLVSSDGVSVSLL